MRLLIAAVGRLKAGAERDLAARYGERAGAAGARLGLTFAVRELGESRAGRPLDRKRDEAGALTAAIAAGSAVVALDEAGTNLGSEALAERIGRWRDGGRPEAAFVVGGPDGLDPDFLARADLRLAFGALTWPHQLVRVMVAEQLYRAITILSGHPYHRA